ncbi:MAG TPA: hypothetical protein VE994_11050 [Terriglobales bacterium]|nr:hypothetical protein [Terriglobales bacterium]
MKVCRVVVCLAAVLMIAPLLAHAQSEVTTFNVPFDFMVGKTMMPAGHYAVQTNASHNNLMIRNEHRSAVVTTQTIDASAGNGHSARLLFRHFDGRYALAEMWGDDPTYGHAIPVVEHGASTRLAKADVVEIKAGQ